MGGNGDLYWWEMMEPRGKQPEDAFAGGRISDLPNFNVFVGMMEGSEGRVEKVYESVLMTFQDEYPWQKKEEETFEILCVSKKAVADWIDIDGEDVPENAVVSGENKDTGKKVYVGRGFHDPRQDTTGMMIPAITAGTINMEDRCLHIFKSRKLEKFQALVLRHMTEEEEELVVKGKKKSDGSGWLFWWEEMDAKSERPENLLITGKTNFRNFYCGVARVGGPHGELGKVAEDGAMYYPHALMEVLVDTGKIEVLCVDPDAKVKWVKSEKGNLPPANAVVGTYAMRYPAYVGRGECNHSGGNSFTPGPIHLAEQMMFAPFGGKAYKQKFYEVLTISE